MLEDTLILDGLELPALFQCGVPKNLGRYHLNGLLGTGGMAKVFHGEYHGTHGFKRFVAVKVAKARPRETEILQREARLMAYIRHPNVVQILDAGKTAGHAYYVMDWIDGWTLKTLVKKHGGLPARICIEVAQQVCRALTAIHYCPIQGIPFSILHGDIKPANIMIGGDACVKLLDFGIASVRDAAIQPRSYGTARYIAPEQLTHQVDCRSDLFALGVVLYEMATGERLFNESDTAKLMRQRLAVEQHLNRSEMTEKVARCHPALVEVVHGCIRARMDERYSSAQAVETALGKAKKRVQPGPSLSQWVQYF